MTKAADLAAGKIATLKTTAIKFTDGDASMTIADGGVVTFAAAPVGDNGGAMELVTKVTTAATDLTALAIAIPETTDFEYLKLIINLKAETASNAKWQMVCRNTADDAFDTGGTDYRFETGYLYSNAAGSSTSGHHDINGEAYIRFLEGFTGDGSDDFETFHLELDMFHTVGTAKHPRFSWRAGLEKRHTDNYHYSGYGFAMCSTAIGLDQIKILKGDGGEFTNQGYTLYKVIK
tara:strand:+ start:49 stop:750 length:702 start_codon:yes stop_codon:yes gene_type:complete